MACPNPSAPKWWMVEAIAPSISLTRSSSALSPPTLSVSLPTRAARTPPETGASSSPGIAHRQNIKGNGADELVISTHIDHALRGGRKGRARRTPAGNTTRSCGRCSRPTAVRPWSRAGTTALRSAPADPRHGGPCLRAGSSGCERVFAMGPWCELGVNPARQSCDRRRSAAAGSGAPPSAPAPWP